MLQDLVENLEKNMELAPLRQEEAGTYILPLDTDKRITITELNPGCYFYSPVTRCPREDREELFGVLMMCNLFGRGTDGAVIGLDPTEENITLSLAIPEEVDYDEFSDHLEDFINQLDFWKDEVDHFEGA